MFFSLALNSLRNRRGSALLTLLAMSVSIFVLLGVEHIRKETRQGFANTVSGVDLIVGARTSRLNLLLYSVFRVGTPTNNIDWQSFKNIAADKNVAWAIPLSLGDSHKGYRVMGTSSDYFTHFNYGPARTLTFAEGQPFNALFDLVLGAQVAKKLGYTLGDTLTLAHGIAETSFSLHENHPFTVVGILEPTGTPVDQTLHISLEGLEAIHIDWQQSVNSTTNGEWYSQALQPQSITAAMLGLQSRLATFNVQRKINQYAKEPLTAILPGVALTELWQIMGILENTLRLVSALVLIASLLGLAAMLLASIRERAQEIQLLRVIGASPLFLFLLIQLEALLISLTGFATANALLFVCLAIAQEPLAAQFGIQIGRSIFSQQSLLFLMLIVIATVVIASIPSYRAYKSAKNPV